MATRWLLLLGLAGCDQVFSLGDRMVSPPGDIGPDGISACVPPGISDDFDDPAPCRPWGFASQGNGLAPMMQSGGRLTIAPDPLEQEYANCTAASPMVLGPSGAFTEISSVIAYPAANTTFKLDSPTPADALVVTLNLTQGRLYFLVGAQGDALADAAYDPVQMRWWRLRPDPGTGSMVAETSPDGRAWNLLGSAPGTLPTKSIIFLGADVYGSDASAPGATVFEQLDVCPPE